MRATVYAREVNNIAVSPEGKILVGISAPCDHRTPTSQYSGAIVSFTPAGGTLTVDASGIRAPVGLTYYPGTSDLFVSMNAGDDLESRTIGAEWSLGKVQRVALAKSVATYSGVVAPFLTGIKNPVAVTTTSGGTFLVGDWTTGTIYGIAPK